MLQWFLGWSFPFPCDAFRVVVGWPKIPGIRGRWELCVRLQGTGVSTGGRAHSSHDELEDSWAGDDPSEPETVTAEPVPSAPADPVQIQALRIVYGTYAPK